MYKKLFEGNICMARNENNGYIYILTNRFVPNVYKIGYTERDASIRAKEISRATGVPGEWEVARDWPVINAYETEQYIFSELKYYRIDKSELFDFKGTSVEDVIKTMDDLLSKKQKNIKKYIEKINQAEAKKNLDAINQKEVEAIVQTALLMEVFEFQYIFEIRQNIAREHRTDSLIEMHILKENNKKLTVYKYGTLIVGVVLAIWLNMHSFLYYVFFAIVLWFISVFIKDNKEEIQKIEDENSKYSMENLSKKLDDLKLIMAEFEMSRIIYIDGLKVIVKPQKLYYMSEYIYNFVLETVYEGVAVSKFYSSTIDGTLIEDEEQALIKFMLFLKSQ